MRSYPPSFQPLNLKVVQRHPIEFFRNSFANLALPFFGFSEPMPAPKKKVKLLWFYFRILFYFYWRTESLIIVYFSYQRNSMAKCHGPCGIDSMSLARRLWRSCWILLRFHIITLILVCEFYDFYGKNSFQKESYFLSIPPSMTYVSNFLKKEHGLTITMMSCGVSMLYSSFTARSKIENRLRQS